MQRGLALIRGNFTSQRLLFSPLGLWHHLPYFIKSVFQQYWENLFKLGFDTDSVFLLSRYLEIMIFCFVLLIPSVHCNICLFFRLKFVFQYLVV